jgi:hypothetical protein
MMFLLGRHATLGQDPPMYAVDYGDAVAFSSKRPRGEVEPVPPPRITRSNASGCVVLTR